MNLFTLPTEIIESILSNLKSRTLLECSLVSRAWRQSPILSRARLYHTITLRHTYQVIPFLCSLIQSDEQHYDQRQEKSHSNNVIILPIGDYVRSISVSDEAIDTLLLWLKLLQQLCPFVESFDPINRLPSSLSNWPQLPTFCHHFVSARTGTMSLHIPQNVTHLDFSRDASMTADYKWATMPHLQRLTLLDWELKKDDIYILQTCAPNLDTLIFIRCTFLETPSSTSSSSSSSFSSVAEKKVQPLPKSSLKSLKLKHGKGLDLAWIESFVQLFRGLETFDISDVTVADSITASSLTKAIASIPTLQCLRLDYCCDASNDSVETCFLPHVFWSKIENPLKELHLVNTYRFVLKKNPKYLEVYYKIIKRFEMSLEKLVLAPQTICPGSSLESVIAPLGACHYLTDLTLDFTDFASDNVDGGIWFDGDEPNEDTDFNGQRSNEWFTMSLPTVLEACQHLVSLTIISDFYDSFIITGGKASSSSASSFIGRKQNKLKQLSLVKVTFDTSLLDYLNYTCQALTTFTFHLDGIPRSQWQKSTMKDESSATLSLPQLSLTALNVVPGNLHFQGYICVTEKHRTMERWYKWDPSLDLWDQEEEEEQEEEARFGPGLYHWSRPSVWQQLARARPNSKRAWQQISQKDKALSTDRNTFTLDVECKSLKEITETNLKVWFLHNL